MHRNQSLPFSEKSRAADCREGLYICPLASGSKGNALYVSNGATALLLDAGLSGIEIERRMASQNLDPKKLDAIVVSHEHTDHTQGVGVLSRRYKLPVHVNRQTNGHLSRLGNFHKTDHFTCGTPFRISDLTIHPFSVSHDATDPAGFTISRHGRKVGIATDLGLATAMVKEHLKGCNVLILEANHDLGMLEHGPYPWPLKQRIKSRIGHLSNEASRQLLAEIKHDGLSHVILAHLSETNNTPQTALQAVGPVLTGSTVQLRVAVQDTCGEVIRLG